MKGIGEVEEGEEDDANVDAVVDGVDEFDSTASCCMEKPDSSNFILARLSSTEVSETVLVDSISSTFPVDDSAGESVMEVEGESDIYRMNKEKMSKDTEIEGIQSTQESGEREKYKGIDTEYRYIYV